MKIGSPVWLPKYGIKHCNSGTEVLGSSCFMGWLAVVYQVVSFDQDTICLTNDGHVVFVRKWNADLWADEVFESKEECDKECQLREEKKQKP